MIRVLSTQRMLVLAGIVVGTAVGGALAAFLPSAYTAESHFFVSSPPTKDGPAGVYKGGLQAEEKALDYAEILSGPAGAEWVVKRLGLDEAPADIAEQIRATVPPNTVIINATVTADSPQEAQRIAEALDEGLLQYAGSADGYADEDESPASVTVTQPPELPEERSSPRTPVYLALGGLLGFAAGIAAAMLRDALGRRARVEDEALADPPALAGIADGGDGGHTPSLLAKLRAETRQHLKILRAHWLLITLAVVVCAGAATAYALIREPAYAASTQLSVWTESKPGLSRSQIHQGDLASQLRAQWYARVVASPSVADAVIEELDLDKSTEDVQDAITATAPSGTALIDIRAEDESPELAKEMADAIAENFPEFAGELDPGDQTSVNVSVTSTAVESTEPDSPSPVVYTAMGALAGVLLGVVGAVLRELLGRRTGYGGRRSDRRSAADGAHPARRAPERAPAGDG